MWVWPNGTVTGSVHWGQLEELVARRDDKSITKDGWARLEALLAERPSGPTTGSVLEPAPEEPVSSEEPTPESKPRTRKAAAKEE